MRKTKKVVSILLSLCMIFVLVPAIFAATPQQIISIAEKPSDNYTQPSDLYALRADGTVMILSSAPYSVPVQVQGLSNIVKLCTDLALDADGNVWRFTGAYDAEQIPELSNIKDIGSGYGKIALAENGDCYVFDGSYDSYWMVPNFQAQSYSDTPYLYATDVALISAGRDGLWMLKNDGTALGLGWRMFYWASGSAIHPSMVPFVKSIAFHAAGNGSAEVAYLLTDGVLLNPHGNVSQPFYYTGIPVESISDLGNAFGLVRVDGTVSVVNLVLDWSDWSSDYNLPAGNVKQILFGGNSGEGWILDNNGGISMLTRK